MRLVAVGPTEQTYVDWPASDNFFTQMLKGAAGFDALLHGISINVSLAGFTDLETIRTDYNIGP